MKAIIVTAFGGPEVLQLQDVSDPTPREGELLIRVRASGVNPVDTYVREGRYPDMMVKPPFIAGTELAGEVAAGPRKGERVYSPLTALGRNAGGHAEFATVNAKHAFTLPDNVSFADGAALPVAFGTAYRALTDVGGVTAGMIVLIHGASGGVGHAATQIAAALGAVVIGTASTSRGQQAVRDAGAAFVFNHSDAGYLDQIKQAAGGKGVDLVIEFLANVNLNNDLDLLAPRGRVVVVGSRGPIEIDPRRTMGKQSSIVGMNLWTDGEPGLNRAYAGINALLKHGAIKPLIGKEFPLAEAAEAQRQVMAGGSVGKIVLNV